MKLIAVNIAQAKQLSYRGQAVQTGIFKEPVTKPVMVRTSGLDGDKVADLSVHGGVYKAVYAYPVEHYEYWKPRLGRMDLPFGQFGENMTVEGMTEDRVQIGDVFRIGDAVLQVTQPRLPCYKLALKMGSMKFPKQFLASGRVGYYFRVLEEGTVGRGDRIQRVSVDPAGVTIQAIVRLAFTDNGNTPAIKKALAIPALSQEWRSLLEERLAAA